MPDPVWAREVAQRNAARRALSDPVKVARAIRIVREGLAEGVITLDKVTSSDSSEVTK